MPIAGGDVFEGEGRLISKVRVLRKVLQSVRTSERDLLRLVHRILRIDSRKRVFKIPDSREAPEPSFGGMLDF